MIAFCWYAKRFYLYNVVATYLNSADTFIPTMLGGAHATTPFYYTIVVLSSMISSSSPSFVYHQHFLSVIPRHFGQLNAALHFCHDAPCKWKVEKI
eukprot:scaffold655672_cov108-Prasinocladus_malaysianus.AAC.1